jgi:hypothetical protein
MFTNIFLVTLSYLLTTYKLYTVWWSSAHSYKNAITNELFLLTSASGYLRTHDQTYLDNANKVFFLYILP